MIDYLLIALIAAPLLARDFYSAAVFSATVVLHDLVATSLIGFAYYGSAAAASLLALALLRKAQGSELAFVLGLVSVGSIAGNLFGYVVWFLYLPPFSYNMFFMAVYLYALLAMITIKGGQGGSLGSSRTGRRGASYSSTFSARLRVSPRDKGQV